MIKNVSAPISREIVAIVCDYGPKEAWKVARTKTRI
jgi:hypothetical protein